MSGTSGWAPWPGGDHAAPSSGRSEASAVEATVLLEVFGGSNAPRHSTEEDGEDLYSVFRARSELMHWAGVSPQQPGALWGIHEAELDFQDTSSSSRIGWVQVGLADNVELVKVLPPLLRCLEDSVRRLGSPKITAFSIAAVDATTARSCASDLASGLNWFETTPPGRVQAELVIDEDAVTLTEAELAESVMNRNTGPFTFRLDSDTVTRPSAQPNERRLLVTLPEWSSDAVAWAMAAVLDTARPTGTHRSFAARVSQIASC